MERPTPYARPSLDEFDRQRALISHQLSELAKGVADVTTLLHAMRVENARRDSTDAALSKDLERAEEALAALAKRLDKDIDTLVKRVDPIETAHKQSKPFVTIIWAGVGGAVAMGAGALLHYIGSR